MGEAKPPMASLHVGWRWALMGNSPHWASVDATPLVCILDAKVRDLLERGCGGRRSPFFVSAFRRLSSFITEAENRLCRTESFGCRISDMGGANKVVLAPCLLRCTKRERAWFLSSREGTEVARERTPFMTTSSEFIGPVQLRERARFDAVRSRTFAEMGQAARRW